MPFADVRAPLEGAGWGATPGMLWYWSLALFCLAHYSQSLEPYTLSFTKVPLLPLVAVRLAAGSNSA